ncbi:ADP-glyceromanno-heptose 6-epimerase [Campylobacter sp. 19-13652]|uniref:ADP-glyceromanno-heptose 6-epimerase n=1 Tax=Campylobacter sp. 19-13652 TaxID=2840180 RepID=UPI001C75E7D3|nr:ADP-glyceromanno-heptose 6-epimerase [Campylobacter sp. 19-13652]BCX80021.1 ADP-L-glycero-D-manno-heptose-6-epimerase [Campylobacter sp. 19-13652]
MNAKRVLITGAAGFIGSALAHHFDTHYKDIRVLALDKFRNNERFSNGNLKSFGHFKNLLGFRGEVIEADINDPRTLEVIKDFAPDLIYHEAAISDTTVSEQDELVRTNVNAFLSLLSLCEKLGAHMVYASSGATYGSAKAPQKVGEAEAPNNAYGFSKLAMDNAALSWSKRTGGVAVGLRYFNVYGKGEFFKERTASMILQFGLQILRGTEPKLFEGSDKIYRDFVYIKDIIQANLKAANATKSGVYNVGTGVARSFSDVVDILQAEFGTNLKKSFIKNPFKSSYQFHTEADIAPTILELGYAPEYTLEQGIKDYADEIRRIYAQEVLA